jgi:hypothetical protein
MQVQSKRQAMQRKEKYAGARQAEHHDTKRQKAAGTIKKNKKAASFTSEGHID